MHEIEERVVEELLLSPPQRSLEGGVGPLEEAVRARDAQHVQRDLEEFLVFVKQRHTLLQLVRHLVERTCEEPDLVLAGGLRPGLQISEPDPVRGLGQIVDRSGEPEAQHDRDDDGEGREGEADVRHLPPEPANRGPFLGLVELHDESPARLREEADRSPHRMSAVIGESGRKHSFLTAQRPERRVSRAVKEDGSGRAIPRMAHRMQRARSPLVPHGDQHLTGLAQARVVPGQLDEIPAQEQYGKDTEAFIVQDQIGDEGDPWLADVVERHAPEQDLTGRIGPST
jgi:hypothetical protein